MYGCIIQDGNGNPSHWWFVEEIWLTSYIVVNIPWFAKSFIYLNWLAGILNHQQWRKPSTFANAPLMRHLPVTIGDAKECHAETAGSRPSESNPWGVCDWYFSMVCFKSGGFLCWSPGRFAWVFLFKPFWQIRRKAHRYVVLSSFVNMFLHSKPFGFYHAFSRCVAAYSNKILDLKRGWNSIIAYIWVKSNKLALEKYPPHYCRCPVG